MPLDRLSNHGMHGLTPCDKLKRLVMPNRLILTATPDRIVEDDRDDDGEDDGAVAGPKRADIASVYDEMGSVLVPRVIPRTALGEQFR